MAPALWRNNVQWAVAIPCSERNEVSRIRSRGFEQDPNGKAPTVEEYLALVHPEEREFVAQAIQKMLADHRGFDFTKRIVRPDGEIRRVRCVGIAATDGGTFQGFVGTGMDITEQEQINRGTTPERA
jgi:PAS domain-containing protein